MKKIIAISFLFIFACKSNPKEEKLEKAITPIITKIDKVEVVKTINKTLISIKKEACSGDCPEFEAKITKDSILEYNGINNVPVLGKHQFKLSTKQYNTLQELLKPTKANKFNESYIDSTKTFLSRTLISFDTQTIEVNLWKDVPDPLINLYTFLEDILYNQKYLEE